MKKVCRHFPISRIFFSLLSIVAGAAAASTYSLDRKTVSAIYLRMFGTIYAFARH